MANPSRGEVDFEVDGKTYTLRFSTNAICELENVLDRSFISISTDLAHAEKNPNAVRFSTLRALLWAGLHERHPDLTLAEAGDLMTDLGGMAKVMDIISEGFTRAFPAPETKGANPRRKAGIGLAS